MAEQNVFIGTFGPFLYDDLQLIPSKTASPYKGIDTSGTGLATGGWLRTGSDIPITVHSTIEDVTASRAVGTVYQNTSGGVKLIQIILTLTG